MPCFHPVVVFQALSGGPISFHERKDYKQLTIPCRKCIGCRLEYSRQWAVRITHESKMHDENCFITLTYDDKHLPPFGSLDYRDFQLFMKRLRKQWTGRVRFFMCGEYGEKLGRPHYHACLFGLDFPDRKLLRTTAAGFRLDRSAILESLWTAGQSSVGAVSFESAAYCARYVCEKITGDLAESHYAVVDSDGVIGRRVPEFCHMSLKPGIGATFLDKFKDDIYPGGKCVVNGKEVNPPRYYDSRVELVDPDVIEAVKFRRESSARANFADNTDARLAVKEVVTTARSTMFKRDNI